jgi:3-dehydroquinate synthase
MSEIFEVKSSIQNYTVFIEKDSIHSILQDNTIFVIIDATVYDLWPLLKLKNIIKLRAHEDKKNLNTVSKLIKSLKDIGATRSSKILSIGGGITQDLSTFCASSYMRGISWTYVPTTLLGMVDSCIGGKSSLNVGIYKNIAGNYFPPEKVCIDPSFCKTLSSHQLVEGLFEAVKICYVYSEERFNKHVFYADPSKDLHKLDFEKIIYNSLISKKEIIEEDEFDKGKRLLLNFGHTFGHALEGASEFKISHGVAVALGMLLAFKLSIQLKLINKNNIRANSLLVYIKTLLKKIEGLGEIIENIDMNNSFNNFKFDKKHSKKMYSLILYNNDGSLCSYQMARSSNNNILILNVFNFLKKDVNEI